MIKYRIFAIVLALMLISLACSKETLKHTISGKVTRDGKQASGTIRVFDPQNFDIIAESKTLDEGKFIIREIPAGEWLIGLTGRTGGIIGNYHYLKIGKLGMVGDYEFDAFKEDPKAKELLSKYGKGQE